MNQCKAIHPTTGLQCIREDGHYNKRRRLDQKLHHAERPNALRPDQATDVFVWPAMGKCPECGHTVQLDCNGLLKAHGSFTGPPKEPVSKSKAKNSCDCPGNYGEPVETYGT